jgi:AraC-like DNA-binding protein
MTLNNINNNNKLTDSSLYLNDQLSPIRTAEKKEEEKKLEKLLWNIKHLQELSSQVLEFNHIQIEVRNGELIIRFPRQNSRFDSNKNPSSPLSPMKKPGEKSALGKKEESKMEGEFLKALNTVMKKNYSDPDFNVEQLAKKLYISQSSLYRKIRAYTGVTPCDYICSYRLERAAHLLKSHSVLVIDVAFEVGFNSRSYFTKCFKEKFHQLPSHFQPVSHGAAPSSGDE